VTQTREYAARHRSRAVRALWRIMPGTPFAAAVDGIARAPGTKPSYGLSIALLTGLTLLATACGSSSASTSTPTSTKATAQTTVTSGAASAAGTGTSFCKDAAAAKSQLLVWATATPGSPSAAAEPLAHSFQTLAGEAPAAIKSQVDDLATTLVQPEKYDTVTDPNVLLQEGPLTNGHVSRTATPSPPTRMPIAH